MSRTAAVVAWCAAALAGVVGAAAGEVQEPPRVVVHMPHGGSVPGRLLDADGGVLRLESDLFAEPLELPVGACEHIRSVAAPAAAAAGAWCELHGGDVVVGSVGESDDGSLVITPASPPGAPPLTIPRRLVAAVEPAESFRVILPGAAAGWELPEGAWRMENGILACSTPGGTAACAAGAPRRACFDLLLAWRERPDFDLAFGVDVGGGRTPPAEVYRVEATAGTALAVRETGAVKFEEVARLAGGAGRLALRVFVDVDAGRMAVVVRDPAGMQHLAFDETVTPHRDEAGGGFFVRLRRGDLRVERLRVSRWTDDAVPVPPPVDEPRVDLPADAVQVSFAGGARLGGRLLGVADGKVRLSTSLAAEPLVISLADVVAIEPLVAAEPPALPGTVGRLSAGDVTLLGCLVGTGSAGLPGWQPLGARAGVPFAARSVAGRIIYRGLDALGGVGVALVRRGDDWQVADVVPGAAADRCGRIHAGDRVTAISQADGEPIPTRGRRDAELRALVAGPIGSTVRLHVEREGGSIDEVDLVRDARGRDDLAGAAPRDVLDRALALQQAAGGGAADRASAVLVLQTGDSVTGTVAAIASGRVRMVIRALDRQVEIAEALVKAVEFGGGSPRPLSRQKLARLLTLPRSQQAAPPRHVLRTVAGDVLRGTLVSLDDAAVRFEVGGIEKQLVRRDVARIIWLAPAPARDAARSADDGLPAVVVGTDGRRLSLAAARVEGPRIAGVSQAFGPMRIGLGACQELLLGGAVDDVGAAENPYEQWVLTPAAPPRGAAGDRRPR